MQLQFSWTDQVNIFKELQITVVRIEKETVGTLSTPQAGVKYLMQFCGTVRYNNKGEQNKTLEPEGLSDIRQNFS